MQHPCNGFNTVQQSHTAAGAVLLPIATDFQSILLARGEPGQVSYRDRHKTFVNAGNAGLHYNYRCLRIALSRYCDKIPCNGPAFTRLR